MNILLVQGHTIVREAVAALIEQTLAGSSVTRASSIAEAEQVERDPSVVVTDLCFDDVEGPEVVEAFRARFAEAGVLVLTLTDDDSFVDLAIAAGARGYLRKDVGPHELAAAIQEIADGGEYLQPSLGLALARRRSDSGNGHEYGLNHPGPPLSPRETDVFKLLVLGHTNAEIATILSVALRTVEAHRARILEKLGMRTRAELVRFAIKSGLFNGPLDDLSL